MTFFKEIENELKFLLKTSNEIGKYSEMILKYNNSECKYFDKNKCEIIQNKINELENIYTDLYYKYFSK